MSDTQWPRFQVFLQESEGEPFLDVGSVHAPDIELALLNARDVFLRRPDGINLWVVPAGAIFSKTEQEIQEQGIREKVPHVLSEQDTSRDGPALSVAKGKGLETGSAENYYVFQKQKSAGTQTMVGELQAASPEAALLLALAEFSPNQPPFAWWVFPARLVVSTGPQDFDSMFAPAGEKHFRMPGDFHIQTALRRIKDQNARRSPG